MLDTGLEAVLGGIFSGGWELTGYRGWFTNNDSFGSGMIPLVNVHVVIASIAHVAMKKFLLLSGPQVVCRVVLVSCMVCHSAARNAACIML